MAYILNSEIREELHKLMDRMLDEEKEIGRLSIILPDIIDGKIVNNTHVEYQINFFTRKEDII